MKNFINSQTALFMLAISGWLFFASYFGFQTIKYKGLKAEYQQIIDRSIKQAELIKQLNIGIEDIATRKHLMDTLVSDINQQIYELQSVQKYIINTIKDTPAVSSTGRSNTNTQASQQNQTQRQVAALSYTTTQDDKEVVAPEESDNLEGDNLKDKLTLKYQWKKMMENFDFLGIVLDEEE